MSREARREPAKNNVMEAREERFKKEVINLVKCWETKLNKVRILKSQKVINGFARAISLDGWGGSLIMESYKVNEQ